MNIQEWINMSASTHKGDRIIAYHLLIDSINNNEKEVLNMVYDSVDKILPEDRSFFQKFAHKRIAIYKSN